MSRGGSGWWQNVKIGAGPIPIETTAGWLLFYHGVTGTCNGFVFSFGAALLDLDCPSRVLYRTRDYLLTPERPYETTGFVPNVAFPCASLQDAAKSDKDPKASADQAKEAADHFAFFNKLVVNRFCHIYWDSETYADIAA